MLGTITRVVRSTIELGLRLIIFAIPIALVANWCDVAPTWKTSAFLTFALIWSGIVFDSKKDSAEPGDSSAIDQPKRIVALLTPAQVAAEARRLTRASRSDESR